jgi:hypothetical protein
LGNPEVEKYRVELKTAESEYFLDGGPRGMILGRKSHGTDDHVVVGLDDDGFSQAHRKVNGREDWRLTRESIQAEADSLAASHVKTIPDSTLTQPETYIISIRRANVLLRIPQAIMSVCFGFFWRLFATKKAARVGESKEFEIVIEKRKIRHLIASAGGHLSALNHLLVHTPLRIQRAPANAMKALAKWVLAKPQELNDSSGGMHFVISKEIAGFLWRNDAGILRYLPAAPLLQIYELAERNLPFGKFVDSESGWADGVKILGRTWAVSEAPRGVIRPNDISP